MAALGFIHVVRGDQEGEAFVRELMNLIPEIAARLRIDARRGFVEEQESRVVDHARGQREPLFPTTG